MVTKSPRMPATRSYKPSVSDTSILRVLLAKTEWICPTFSVFLRMKALTALGNFVLQSILRRSMIELLPIPIDTAAYSECSVIWYLHKYTNAGLNTVPCIPHNTTTMNRSCSLVDESWPIHRLCNSDDEFGRLLVERRLRLQEDADIQCGRGLAIRVLGFLFNGNHPAPFNEVTTSSERFLCFTSSTRTIMETRCDAVSAARKSMQKQQCTDTESWMSRISGIRRGAWWRAIALQAHASGSTAVRGRVGCDISDLVYVLRETY